MSESGKGRSRRILTLVTAILVVAAACRSAVPSAIDAVGHHAENAYDMVRANDWAKARASVDSLEAAVVADSGTRAAIGPTTQQLRGAVAGRDRHAALVAANRLTEIGARMSERYAPAVPADVTLLDYYGRELEIWAASSDLAKLRETGNAITDTWEALRARVEQRGGTTEATRFGGLVHRIGQARTVSEFAALATPILDEVDALEGVFKR